MSPTAAVVLRPHTQFLHCHLTSCWRCTCQTKIAVAVASQGGTHSGMQEQRDRRPRPAPPIAVVTIVDIVSMLTSSQLQSPASTRHPHILLVRAVNAYSWPMGPQARMCIKKMPGGCPVDCLIVIAPSLPWSLCLHCHQTTVVKYTGGISKNHTNNAPRQWDSSARYRATTQHVTTIWSKERMIGQQRQSKQQEDKMAAQQDTMTEVTAVSPFPNLERQHDNKES